VTENSDEHGGGRGHFDTRHEIVTLLIEKIRRDPYPSTTMMDLVEEMLAPEDIPAYAGVLMEKIRQDAFPSIDLMNRVRDLT
jgi:hypothetical protein